MNVTEFPRFRDVFISKKKPKIKVYTRTGGDNREEYEGIIALLEGYLEDYDDGSDETYAYWVYQIPERSREDWKKYVEEMRPIE